MADEITVKEFVNRGLELLGEDVNNANTSIENHNQEIEKLKEDVLEISENISNLPSGGTGSSGSTETVDAKNQWKDKKIVLLGTSVAFGQYAQGSAYIDTASKKLGFNYINCGVPGLGLNAVASSSTTTKTPVTQEEDKKGYWDTSANKFVTNADWHTYVYTVSEGQKYSCTLTIMEATTAGICYFDASGNILSHEQDGAGEYKNRTVTTTVPSGATKMWVFGRDKAPSASLVTTTEGGVGKLTYGSFVLTKEEYSNLGTTIPDAPIDYTPGGSYNDYFRTYENVFTEAVAGDADLFIYAVAPNSTEFGTTDYDAFNFDTWAYTDGSSFADHRTTFLGALLFTMDKMYEVNPNARMVFLLDSQFAYSDGKTALSKISSKYNIPIINLWGKINTSPKSLLKMKAENGANDHPSKLAQELMGNMLANELLLIN